MTLVITRADIERIRDAAEAPPTTIRDLAITALGLMDERDAWAGRWAEVAAERDTKKPCDLYGNGSSAACAGPTFTDPLPELDLRICAFHALLNRNEWAVRAEKAEARCLELEEGLALEEDEHAHDLWASCGCLAGGVGHDPKSPECPMSARPTAPPYSPPPARPGGTEYGA